MSRRNRPNFPYPNPVIPNGRYPYGQYPYGQYPYGPYFPNGLENKGSLPKNEFLQKLPEFYLNDAWKKVADEMKQNKITLPVKYPAIAVALFWLAAYIIKVPENIIPVKILISRLILEMQSKGVSRMAGEYTGGGADVVDKLSRHHSTAHDLLKKVYRFEDHLMVACCLMAWRPALHELETTEVSKDDPLADIQTRLAASASPEAKTPNAIIEDMLKLINTGKISSPGVTDKKQTPLDQLGVIAGNNVEAFRGIANFSTPLDKSLEGVVKNISNYFDDSLRINTVTLEVLQANLGVVQNLGVADLAARADVITQVAEKLKDASGFDDAIYKSLLGLKETLSALENLPSITAGMVGEGGAEALRNLSKTLHSLVESKAALGQ